MEEIKSKEIKAVNILTDEETPSTSKTAVSRKSATKKIVFQKPRKKWLEKDAEKLSDRNYYWIILRNLMIV